MNTANKKNTKKLFIKKKAKEKTKCRREAKIDNATLSMHFGSVPLLSESHKTVLSNPNKFAKMQTRKSIFKSKLTEICYLQLFI